MAGSSFTFWLLQIPILYFQNVMYITLLDGQFPFLKIIGDRKMARISNFVFNRYTLSISFSHIFSS